MALDISEFFDDAVGYEAVDQDVVERLRFDDRLEIPHQLTDADIWDNYTNKDLYAIDKEVRAWLKKTRHRRRSSEKGIKTTAALTFAYIFGRQPTPQDAYACKMIHRVLMYYCTSYTGKTSINGKKVNRVYKFSQYSGVSKRPMSLRLRLEEMDDYKESVWRRGTHDSRDKRDSRLRNRQASENADGGSC